MSILYKNNYNIYRYSRPAGHYDILIVSLVHQGPEMIEYMYTNIQKYVKGKFIWIVHYNGTTPISELYLPPWVWLVRTPIETDRYTRSLVFAINECLKFALTSISFTNVLTFSSGSVFFRDFFPPTTEKIALTSHEILFEPSKNYSHINAIPIQYVGKCAKYLEEKGSLGWQYKDGGDDDIEFHSLIKAREFTYIRGCQWTGQIWPFNVAKMLVEDITKLQSSNKQINYACEEIYLATYAYNYAIKHNIQVDYTEVIINWKKGKYNITDSNWLLWLLNNHKYGSAACKIPDNVNHPVRKIINTSSLLKNVKLNN